MRNADGVILLGVLTVILTCAVASATVVYDDFNDNNLNTSLWTPMTAGGVTMSEVNQRLEVTIPSTGAGGTFYGTIHSTRALRGDFDIQMDYELLTWPTGNGARVGFSAALWNIHRASYGTVEGGPREIIGSDFGGGHSSGFTNGDLAGTLRLARVGSTLSSYYLQLGTWMPVYSYAVGSGDVSYFSPAAWSHDPVFADQYVKIAFDNFIVNSGELSPPVPEPSSLLALLCGIGGLGGVIRRRKK